MKRKISFLLCLILLFSLRTPAAAEETGAADAEWYEMTEENFEITLEDAASTPAPATLYIGNVLAYITKISTGKIGIRAEVLCAGTLPYVEATIYLQKKINGTWTNVSSGTVSDTDTAHMVKSVTVTGVSSGTYRAKVVGLVEDSSGYTETLTCYTGGMKMS